MVSAAALAARSGSELDMGSAKGWVSGGLRGGVDGWFGDEVSDQVDDQISGGVCHGVNDVCVASSGVGVGSKVVLSSFTCIIVDVILYVVLVRAQVIFD